MKSPLFSVIVPIYNVEKYLEECINSVLNQTFLDYELILVDDGSTDNSGIICDQYQRRDNRVKVIHKENGGLVSARKAGVNIAQGQYALAIDGDDYIREDALQLFSEIIHNHGTIDLICYNFYLLYDTKVVMSETNEDSKLLDKESIKRVIFPYLIEDRRGRYFRNSVCGKVFKTELYKKYQNLVDDQIKIGEDLACTKPLIFNCNTMYIFNEYLYFYRQNHGSMTKSKKPFSMLTPRLIGEHLENAIDMDYEDNQEQVYRSVVHQLFNACYSQFFRHDETAKTKDDIRHVLCCDYYRKAIKNCKFSVQNIKGNIALICLKYQLFELMKLYAKLK